MTVLIASLFLPFTLDFHLENGTHRRKSRTSSRPASPRFNRRGSVDSRPSSPASPASPITTSQNAVNLFKKGQQHPSLDRPMLTPGATTDHERIFSVSSIEKLKLAEEAVQTAADDLHTLAPSDPHPHAWGSAKSLTQPKAQTLAPPSPSILKHEHPRDKSDSLLRQAHATAQEQQGPSPPDGSFSRADYSVVPAEQGNGGLRNAVRAAIDSGVLEDKLWVGTLGMPTDALDDETRSAINERFQAENDCLTVFIDDGDFDGHYSHFCKTILWPVFHYQIPDNPKSKAYEDHSWVYYVKINEAFAQEIARNWKRGDIVWVHDYHLLLVPAMLRKLLPEAQIGFFLHVAFPSSEVFRCLAVRKELLEGVLGANMIGFQTEEYCRHFLQTCSRILCVEATNEGILLEDRFVQVGEFPIGIDQKSLDIRRQNPDVFAWIRAIKERYRDKQIIVARDKLDHVRGVRQKLLSYELFLNMYPEMAHKVVLIQVASSTTEQPELDNAVSEISMRINSTHSTLAHQPLVFLKQDLSFAQYLALITVADSLIVTSLREGMNLTSHEFIHCQDGKFADTAGTKCGSLILSEFTGSASVFGNLALLVNPWDYNQCAEAIHRSLEMSAEEREKAWIGLNEAVTRHAASKWFQNYIVSLDKAWREQNSRDMLSVPRLSVDELKQDYQHSERRLFIIDYEGTLASWGSPTSIILTTPQRAIDTLNDLLEDPKNIVYVMSARMPEEMERLFRRVSGLGLIAENGCFIREPNSEEWIKMAGDDETKHWKESVEGMLEYFHERTDGSWIQHRHCSLVFHYGGSEDKQLAARQASECANHVNDACASQHIHAVPIEGALIVEPTNINKATASDMVLRYLRARSQANVEHPVDFLLVIGDGRDDEVVFRWANKLAQNKIISRVKTVTIGSKNTDAMATITQGVTGTLSCLQELAFS